MCFSVYCLDREWHTTRHVWLVSVVWAHSRTRCLLLSRVISAAIGNLVHLCWDSYTSSSLLSLFTDIQTCLITNWPVWNYLHTNLLATISILSSKCNTSTRVHYPNVNVTLWQIESVLNYKLRSIWIGLVYCIQTWIYAQGFIFNIFVEICKQIWYSMFFEAPTFSLAFHYMKGYLVWICAIQLWVQCRKPLV